RCAERLALQRCSNGHQTLAFETRAVQSEAAGGGSRPSAAARSEGSHERHGYQLAVARGGDSLGATRCRTGKPNAIYIHETRWSPNESKSFGSCLRVRLTLELSCQGGPSGARVARRAAGPPCQLQRIVRRQPENGGGMER